MAVEHVEEQLRRVTGALDAAHIPYAVVGGNAVAAWVATADPEATRATKDVDVLIRRADLERIRGTLEPLGYEFKQIFGVCMFVERLHPSPRTGVHLVFASEKVRETDEFTAPDVDAAVRSPAGFLTLDLPALVAMKLSVFRRVDQVHLEDMLSVGLIDADLVSKLPEKLVGRLREIRDTMEWHGPPPQF
jgi:hypothetical protein